MRWIKPFLVFFSAGGPAVAAPYLDTVPPDTEKLHALDGIPKVTLYPVIESSILTKRANKFALMDEITLLWKNGAHPIVYRPHQRPILLTMYSLISRECRCQPQG